MKNKKTTWILLPAVLSIWGFLGWKLYASMQENDSIDVHPEKSLTLSQTQQIVPDTYQLLLDYPDPFLSITKPPVKPPVVNKTVAEKVPVKNTEPVSAPTWPEVRYSGLVKSPKDGKMVGFLSVNGVSHFVKNQDIVGDLQVVKLWNDSAKVGFGKETKVIKK